MYLFGQKYRLILEYIAIIEVRYKFLEKFLFRKLNATEQE